ncbi:Transcription elongation factor Spt5, NGN domain [Sesbania bispinosa]|nr:Transcription elongation factor Spt5, NGN domain [Sesbania bispinosa]
MVNKGKGKGKEIAGKAPAGKRKGNFDDDKTGGGRKRKNRGVLQFFEDAADVEESDLSDDSDDSDFSDDFFDVEFDTLSTMMNGPAKGQGSLPCIPKEEMVDEEEFDRMMEERYGEGSRFAHFAGDEFDDKPIEPNSLQPGVKELIPTIWKVKCTVGRERVSAFCLMQKFADLKSLGTKLQIISAFAVDHMKGFVYIEAEKQCDINEACNGISGIYVTRVQPVPTSEVHHLFSVRKRSPEISEGMWARIKSGNYKGDLAQVVALNNTRKKVTVKLIPRIDLQALAAKFGGGYSRQKTAVPAPRLICSSELEEFRPLIQFRRDQDTGKVFEVLDGLLLKDGFVYKKVSPDSLSLWGVEPTEEELLKFGSSENNESNDLEWLSQLYGDSKKKRVIGGADKGGGKGEGSSSSGVVNGFELFDLVCFGKKDFGLIISMDKEDNYKILQEGSDGPVAVTIERNKIKSGLFDLKLTAQDQHAKTIMVNDNVRVLEGPSKDKQGIVKHIYRGIVFLYNADEEEYCGYFTAKSNMCEKIKLAVGDCSGKTLRIRIGPLKGYLCRVIALRRSDVTVKLDSQQKVLTVKCEHLSEVQGKSTAMSTSGDPDSSSLKPFDLLGTEGSSGGGNPLFFNSLSSSYPLTRENFPCWMDGVGTSTGGGGWNAGGTSAERSAWSNHSAPSFLKQESSSNPLTSDGAEDTVWETKKTSNQNSSWGAAVDNNGITSNPDQSGGWGNGGGNWGQAEQKTNVLDGNQSSGWDSKSNWNTTKASKEDTTGWNSVKKSNESSATGWGQGNGFKSGSDDGGNLNHTWSGWKSGTSGIKEVVNPAGTSNFDDNQEAGWKNNPSKDGNEPSGWEGNNNWNAPISSSQVKSGWNQKSTEDDKEEKATGLDQASGWGDMKSGSSTVADRDSSMKWGQGTVKSGSADGPKQASNWGTFKSESSSGNENQNSNWSSGCPDAGRQDSNWGKKGSWNSGGNQASDENNSNWNSGSGDSNQNSNWGNKSNWNSDKSSWGSGNENKNSNWSSGNTDSQTQDSDWGKKSNWNSGSGGTSQNTNWRSNGNWNTGDASNGDKLSGENEGFNETSEDGNGRGGYRGRGGFRGRGFRGRGERGGFGGRGERGGFGGRGERGGFGGRGERGGFGGRGERGGFGGRGQPTEAKNGGWNKGSGWGQSTAADKEPPSWNQGGGSNKQWQSGSSASGGASDDWNSKGSKQTTEATDGGWNKGSGWGQSTAADKEPPSWNQGGGSNKQWQSGSSASGGASDDWNSKVSKQTAEATDGGWSKGSGWGQSTAADKGQPSSWNESADAGSWGKKNDGSDKGGW